MGQQLLYLVILTILWAYLTNHDQPELLNKNIIERHFLLLFMWFFPSSLAHKFCRLFIFPSAPLKEVIIVVAFSNKITCIIIIVKQLNIHTLNELLKNTTLLKDLHLCMLRHTSDEDDLVKSEAFPVIRGPFAHTHVDSRVTDVTTTHQILM